MPPRVTVLVPAYNSEKTITQTLQSVIEQKYMDWEMIVIDDGSSDSTADIVAQFSDPRIRLIQKTNGGTSTARNLGISNSCAEYIQFLDADDLILPQKLTRHVNILDSEHEVGVVYSSFHYFYDDYCEIRPPTWLRAPSDDPFRDLMAGSMFPPHAALVRSSLVSKVGLFDENLISGEDWDFWLRMAKMGVKFLFHNELLALYRQHPGSKTKSLERWRREHVEIIEKVRESITDEAELKRIQWYYFAAYNYVLWALALLLEGDEAAAFSAFARAYSLNADLGHAPEDLAKQIAEYALLIDQQPTTQLTGEDWLEKVLLSLPDSYPSEPVLQVSQVLYWHAKAFEAHQGNKDGDVRRYLWSMVSHRGTDYMNLGTLSILLQSIIGKNNWRKLKKVWS